MTGGNSQIDFAQEVVDTARVLGRAKNRAAATAEQQSNDWVVRLIARVLGSPVNFSSHAVILISPAKRHAKHSANHRLDRNPRR